MLFGHHTTFQVCCAEKYVMFLQNVCISVCTRMTLDTCMLWPYQTRVFATNASCVEKEMKHALFEVSGNGKWTGCLFCSQNPYWYRAISSEPCFYGARSLQREGSKEAISRFQTNPLWMHYTQCHFWYALLWQAEICNNILLLVNAEWNLKGSFVTRGSPWNMGPPVKS
jgi:hypothetical protein